MRKLSSTEIDIPGVKFSVLCSQKLQSLNPSKVRDELRLVHTLLLISVTRLTMTIILMNPLRD